MAAPGSVNPLAAYKCFHPHCTFLVSERVAFGGFCCLKCHWHFHTSSASQKQHGWVCQGIEAPANALTSPFRVPQYVMRPGAKSIHHTQDGFPREMWYDSLEDPPPESAAEPDPDPAAEPATAPSIRETLAEIETVALRSRLLAIKTTTDPVPNLAPPPADPDDPPSDNPLLAAVYYAHLKEEKRALDAVMMPPPQSKRGRSS